MLGMLACAGSGLSSSAAIVCASALAVLGYYGVSVDKGVSTCLSAPCRPRAGSGLSSSSALVCAAALAYLAAYQIQLPRAVSLLPLAPCTAT